MEKTKEQIKEVIGEISLLGLTDEDSWIQIQERLDMTADELMQRMSEHPAYFGYAKGTQSPVAPPVDDDAHGHGPPSDEPVSEPIVPEKPPKVSANTILNDDQVMRILRILRRTDKSAVKDVTEGLAHHGVTMSHAQVYTRLEKLADCEPPLAERVRLGVRNFYKITDSGSEMTLPGEDAATIKGRVKDVRSKLSGKSGNKYSYLFVVIMIIAIIAILVNGMPSFITD